MQKQKSTARLTSMREQRLVKQRYPHIHWDVSNFLELFHPMLCHPSHTLLHTADCPKACARVTVIHTRRLSVQRSLRCTWGIQHEYVQLVSSTYGNSGLLLVCTSITVTVDDFEEKATRDILPSNSLKVDEEANKVDHCFNGWQCSWSQKLLEFLMTKNSYLTYFQQWKAIRSCCLLA